MAKIITIGDLFQGGRVQAPDAGSAPTYIRYAQDIVVADGPLEFQFPQGASTGLTFGICRSLFIDNSRNDYEMEVVVGGTLQTFPIPANSTGWYIVNAQSGSAITLTSDGDSSGIVEVIFYNYDNPAYVYYKFGASTTAVTIADGADVTQGAVADAAETNPLNSASVVSLLKGILTLIDTATVGTAVTVADGADVALGDTNDAAVTNPASVATAIALLKGLLTLLTSIDTDTTNIETNTQNTATSVASIDTKSTAIETNTSDTVVNTADIVLNTSAFSYDNITTSTTTVVKNAPGVLGKVTVNAAGAAGSIIVYDNTAGSGSIIATLDSTVIGSFDFNAIAATGITVVTTGAPDITVLYR